MPNIQDLLHKRILVATKDTGYRQSSTVEEVKILEISPSGNWIKIQNQNGAKIWKSAADVVPIEILNPTDKPTT